MMLAGVGSCRWSCIASQHDLADWLAQLLECFASECFASSHVALVILRSLPWCTWGTAKRKRYGTGPLSSA